MAKKITKSECIAAAKKYDYRGDFAKGDRRLYNKAWREGWLDEICGHMGGYKHAKKKAKTNKRYELDDLLNTP